MRNQAASLPLLVPLDADLAESFDVEVDLPESSFDVFVLALSSDVDVPDFSTDVDVLAFSSDADVLESSS